MDFSAALFVDIVKNFTFGHVRRSISTVVHPNTASIFVALTSGGYYELHPYLTASSRITGLSLPRISDPWLGHKVAGYTSHQSETRLNLPPGSPSWPRLGRRPWPCFHHDCAQH